VLFIVDGGRKTEIRGRRSEVEAEKQKLGKQKAEIEGKAKNPVSQKREMVPPAIFQAADIKHSYSITYNSHPPFFARAPVSQKRECPQMYF
jgi:hypothetical protein